MSKKPLTKQPAAGQKVAAGMLGPGSYDLLYFNMPKSGCTSIKNILYYLDKGQFLDDPLTIHARSDLLINSRTNPHKVRRRIATGFVFTFVRHPLKRAYSCFNEKVHSTGKYAFPRVRACLIEQYGAQFPDDLSLEQHRANFLLFLKLVEDSFSGANTLGRNPHWSPQAPRIRHVSRFRILDFVGRIEAFDRDLKFVLSRVGYTQPISPPRLNEGPPPPYGYDIVMNDEVMARGKFIYGDDFRSLGYEY